MIKSLISLFKLPAADTEDKREHQVQLAAAALLVETARADFVQDGSEEAALGELLLNTLGLAKQEVTELMAAANKAADQATSLYEFTRLINDHYTPEQKTKLINAMWRVAYADGRLDKYEEHLIRRVAELTYVPHEEYIRCKLAAKG